MNVMPAIILWLFALNLGIAFGAGLYESRIVVPQWLTDAGSRWNAQAARDANVGLRFWIYTTTIPLTLLTLASLVAANWAPQPVRFWWLAGAVAALVDRVMTFAYFVPTMLTLMREGALTEAAAVSKARQWVRLGYLRQAATLVAWLASLRALALTGV
jgi:hypothetical protein